jgi:FkbM family methyltransferase
MLDLSKVSKTLYVLSNPKLVSPVLDGLVVDTYAQLDKPWIHEFGIDTVIDIGANFGRTVITFRQLFPDAAIYAFEPLPDCYKKLLERTKKISNLQYFNVALGAETSELSMNQSSYLPSSSLLEMENSHSEAFPFTAGSEEIKVKVLPLDSMNLEIGKSLLIKVDVQGYEDRVIDGGLDVFSKAKIVILEVSYQSLYKDQVLFDGVYSRMSKLGFDFAGTLGNLIDPRTGVFLEADAIFIKRNP